MAAKVAKAMPAGHTAGIFADMTLDGPVIGTLIAVVVRAKNLPNRKTMGKQDPYCALRLGKEAHKTRTDKRGGQTPKWDEELRFEVHDSPDYYKLKCSIFNDDKKTELIGEAWIDLNDMLVEGRRQKDLWHPLTFRGKNAGDVRIELTYYDTRPIDGSDIEKRPDKKVNRGVTCSNNDDGAPRKLGPREVKRRPLPANPVELAAIDRPSPQKQVRSSPPPPAPLIPPAPRQNGSAYNLQQVYDDQGAPNYQYHSRNETSLHAAPSSGERANVDHPTTGATEHQQPQQLAYSNFPGHLPSSFENQQPQQLAYSDFPGPLPSSYENQQPQEAIHSSFPGYLYDNVGHPGEPLNSDDSSSYSAQSSFPANSPQPLPQTPSHAERRHSIQASEPQAYGSSPYQVSAPYGSSPPSYDHDRSPPGSVDQRNHASFRRYSTSPIKNEVFRDSPLRQSISQHDVEPTLQAQYDLFGEGSPPPPPAHRSNFSATASTPDIRQDLSRVQVPQPLNLGPGGRHIPSFDRSPLQSIERNHDPEYQSVQFCPPSEENEYLYSPYSSPAYSAEAHSARIKSYDSATSRIENTPPSLRAGYNSLMEGTEDSRTQAESHGQNLSLVHVASPTSQDMGVLRKSVVRYQMPRVEDERQMSSPEPPYIEPQAGSSDAATVPKRKAVSPQPVSVQDEQKLDAVPFGPDSYEIFNPSSPLSSAVAGPDSRYETPEQAKEAARQHEVQKLRDQGPIIGNDGRIIDPSDHLPTDTWAPEPERRNRKPEMVIRYKTKEHSPQTPQRYGSSPGSARPHSTTSPFYGSSPLAIESPTSLLQQNKDRNRLQKHIPGRPIPAPRYQQPHSSPALPTANHNTPSPGSTHPSHTDLPEYTIHGQHNQMIRYGSGLGAHSGGAPPIPAKVPIPPLNSGGSYGGYIGMDALSAELSTIDIGAGLGNGGSRGRRGYGS